MKRKAIFLVVALSLPQAAMADVYVKVDANGNAVGGAIMCDAATCGSGSLYSQLTLQPGEHYQLQGTGQSGIGNNNPGVLVKHEAATNEWVVTNTNTPVPAVERFATIETRQPVVQDPVPAPAPGVDTKTVTILDSSTVLVDTTTVIIVETSTVVVDTATVQNKTIQTIIKKKSIKVRKKK
jgi:hypothetical protein